MQPARAQLPYLIEWITYYQIQGAHRVAICDLMSTDRSAPLREASAKLYLHAQWYLLLVGDSIASLAICVANAFLGPALEETAAA